MKKIYNDFAWLIVFIITIGGYFEPRLGLLLLPMMVYMFFSGMLSGKYWCGNICPHGILFDRVFQLISRNKYIPSILKKKRVAATGLIVFMGGMTFRVFKIISLWGEGDFLYKLGTVMVINYTIVTIIGVSLAIIYKPRSWCRVCPMGNFQLLMGKALFLKKHFTYFDKKVSLIEGMSCASCKICSKECPIEIDPHTYISTISKVSTEMCIKCSKCVNACPINAIDLT